MGMIIILEIVRIVLAVAVGYIVANKMAASVAMNGNTEEKKKITNTEEEVNNIPTLISFSQSEANSSTDTDKRPLLLKSSMQSDDMSEDHHVDIDESDRCCSVMSVDPPGQLVRQRSKRMNVNEVAETPFRVQAESMWNKKQTNVLQNAHDETTSSCDIDSVSSSSVRMILQMEDTHNREIKRLQRIHQHQNQIKKQRRRMSSISWEDTDGEEDEAEAPTKQMPPFLAKCQSSEWQVREEADTKNVTNNRRGSKEKQDDIRLMLGLHSSSEQSTCTRRNSYYTLSRPPKLSCLMNSNRRKSASNAAA